MEQEKSRTMLLWQYSAESWPIQMKQVDFILILLHGRKEQAW